MAHFSSSSLSYSCLLPPSNPTIPQPYHSQSLTPPFPSIPTNFLCHKLQSRSLLSAIPSTDCIENVQTLEREKPSFKWVEVNSDCLTEEQKLAISMIPKKMTKRCKALLRQIIYFSPEKGKLCDLLGAWVRIMKPIRADWLAVLKELRILDHPFLLEVFEFALSEESFEPNVRDYTKMVHIYAKQNRLQDAQNTLLAMNKRGMTSDQVTLTTMIHMYSKAGNLNLAEQTFYEMKLFGQTLDRRSYGSMIMAYIRARMLNKAEDLLREMEALEVYAGREVYKALLRAYSLIGDSEGSQRVFDAIQLAGICPDVKLCALLINAYAVNGQCEKARVVFENMRRAGLTPNDKCVALLLGAYEKENQIYAALDLLTDLESEGIMVEREGSEGLVQWFRRLGVVDEVADVLREYVVRGVTVKGALAN